MPTAVRVAPARAAVAAAHGADWPQFQFDAASRGRAPKPVEPPYQLRWVWYGEDNVAVGGRPFPEGHVPRPPRDTLGLLSFTMHAVVADGRVVFGDLQGKLYCLSARDGSTVWTRQFPGAFVHAAAIWTPTEDSSNNVIVAPCQDGRVHALSWDGRALWQVEAARPFVTPAKLEGGVAYAGSLDGRLYAVDVATGKVRWRYDAGAAIRQPAAIAGGRAFVGSEDMVFHAIDAATGRPLWRTRKGQMTGQSFRNTWPVVVGDKVMTFQILVDGHAEFVMEALLFNATPGDHRHKRLEHWPAERDAILKWLAGDMTWAVDGQKGWQKNPGKVRDHSRNVGLAGGPLRKSFYVFDVAGDGRGHAVEPYQVPMGIVGGTGNGNMGPVLDAKGRPITWWRVSARSIITGGGFGTSFSPDLSALDLATGDRIILPTTRDIHKHGPGMELDNHHMLTAAGDLIYYHNPFRKARWVRLDGKTNPVGAISAAYRRHDGGGWNADVVYYPTKDEAGHRAKHLFDSHGAARTPVVVADDALFVNEIDLRALACYETRGTQSPVGPQPRPAAAELRRRLAEHVLDMAKRGHLLPYYAKRGELHPRWYFTNPGDTIAALARAYPPGPDGLKPRLAAYMKQELESHPPFAEGLNAPDGTGASRMDFAVPKHKWEWRPQRYLAMPRAHNVYALWLYADATGDKDAIKRHWSDIRGFYERHRAETALYVGGASAPIGLARLARLVGDAATENAAVRDAAEALKALDRLGAMQAPAAARHGFGGKWPGRFVYLGFHLLHLMPETARYIRDHPRAYQAAVEATANAVDHWPMWFISQASAFSRYYGESHALSPLWSAMIFPVKALVERAEPQRLRAWVDAEDAPRGDLFYIERLALAIEALGTSRWVEAP